MNTLEAQPSLLMPIQDLFKFSIFRVPNYQRGYAWGEQQVTDLLNDLEDLEQDKTHYTGTVVLVKKDKKEHLGESHIIYDIIDGQQRLATIVILFQCLYEQYQKLKGLTINGESAGDIAGAMRESYIAKGNTAKLILNKDSNEFFKNYIIKVIDVGDVVKTQNTSQQNLKNARETIGAYLHSRLNFRSDQERLEELESIRRKITNGLVVNRYVVESDAEAGVIFEVMNDRGKPLSGADKIKNYLIYLSYKVENKGDDRLAETINEYWGEIFRNLMASRRSSEDDFLRYHWITFTNEQKEYDIHRRVKHFIGLKDMAGNKVGYDKVERTVTEYAADLREASFVFYELNQPDSPDAFSDDVYGSSKGNKQIRETMDKLHRLGSLASFYPLLISARRFFANDPASFLEILCLLELFSFRVLVVGNRKANAGQAAFYTISNQLHRSRRLSGEERDQVAQKARNRIAQAIHDYGSDESFERHLTSESFYRDLQSHEIKYFFYELEMEKANAANEDVKTEWAGIAKDASVEHIWPQTPRGYDEWSEEEQGVHQENVHRLGNLTITLWNSPLSNLPFLDTDKEQGKRSRYPGSKLRVQSEIADYDDWGIPEIEDREEKLVSFAFQRWPLPDVPDMEALPIDKEVQWANRQEVRSIIGELVQFIDDLAVFPDTYHVYRGRKKEEGSLYTDFLFGGQELRIWAELGTSGLWVWVASNSTAALAAENRIYIEYLVNSLGVCDDFDENERWSVCYGDDLKSVEDPDERRQAVLDMIKRVTKAVGEAIEGDKGSSPNS